MASVWKAVMIRLAPRTYPYLSQTKIPGNRERGSALLALRLIFFLLAFLSAPVCYAETGAAPTYVAPATLPPELLPVPPAEGSPEWHEDLATIVAMQEQSPSLDEMSAMRTEQQMRVELVTDILGPKFTRTDLPKTFLMLDRVLTDATLIADTAKKYWNTKRPYAADSHVKLLIDPPANPLSYPSGHACESRVLAEILALLIPGKRDELRARAEEIAQRRVMEGVHYSFDLEGGRMLAMLTVGALMRSEPFRQDLAAAREEMESKGFKKIP